MTVKYSFNNDSLNLFLCGELDECSASKTRDIIDKLISLNNNVNNVIFNLSDLVFMDSTGIGMMIGSYKKINARGAKAFLTKPSTQIKKILDISGLYQIMPLI